MPRGNDKTYTIDRNNKSIIHVYIATNLTKFQYRRGLESPHFICIFYSTFDKENIAGSGRNQDPADHPPDLPVQNRVGIQRQIVSERRIDILDQISEGIADNQHQ